MPVEVDATQVWKITKCDKGTCSYIVVRDGYNTIACEATMCNYMNVVEIYAIKNINPSRFEYICNELCNFIKEAFKTLHDDVEISKVLQPLFSIECQNEAILEAFKKQGFKKSASIFKVNNLVYASKRYGTNSESIELVSSSGKTIVINIS